MCLLALDLAAMASCQNPEGGILYICMLVLFNVALS